MAQIKAKTEKAQPIGQATEETPSTSTSDADDFFSSGESGPTSLKDFLGHMKEPVEEMEPPPGFDDPEEEDLSEEDRATAAYLDYDEEHEMTAFLLLSNLDRVLAFLFSLISGDDMEKYRRRGNQLKGQEKDLELQVAAALVKKYQMRMSLEWMFATAIVMGYGPIAVKAVSDRKRIKKEKEEAERRRQAEERFQTTP